MFGRPLEIKPRATGTSRREFDGGDTRVETILIKFRDLYETQYEWYIVVCRWDVVCSFDR